MSEKPIEQFTPPIERAEGGEVVEIQEIEPVPEIKKIIEGGNRLLGDASKQAEIAASQVTLEILNTKLESPEKEILLWELDKEIGQAQQELNSRVFEAVKSWWVYVHNTSRCFKCAYCILSSRNDLKEEGGMSGLGSFINREIGEVPSRVSEVLRKIPVSINNYFGDPGIQWKDTLGKLEQLETSGHEGPIGVISKSYFNPEKAKRLADSRCRVVVLQSISNLPENIEPMGHAKRIESIKNLVEAGVPTVAYLRPLIPGYNTYEDILRATLDSIAQSGCKMVCYSGLRGTTDVIDLLEKQLGKRIEPPPGYQEWQKDHKLVEGKIKDFIESYAKKLGLKVFRKTSCAVSYASGLESDYNCHWEQPEKYGCGECDMAEGCSRAVGEWEGSAEQRVNDTLKILGAEGSIEKKPRKTACQLKEVCHYPCSSCPVSGGTKLHLKGKWSLGELSVARWVAGIPVEADEIIDTPRIFHLNTEPQKPAAQTKVDPEHFYRKPGESACPQGCAYCIVDLNPERKKEYEEGIEYFMNSFVAINLPLRDRQKHLEQLEKFDFEKLRGDVVGFQGASEPMLFPREMDFVCQKAREFGFKVAICTKATILPEKAVDLYNRYGDVLEVEVSYAKLGELERTDKTRLSTIKSLINAGFEPLVVIQPFIYGLTDRRLDGLLQELRSVGVQNISVNGFRYNKSMEGWARRVLPAEWLKRYQEHEGEEWLPDREEITQKIREAGFEYTKIGDWLKRRIEKRQEPPTEEEILHELAAVKGLMSIPENYFNDWQFEGNKIIFKKDGIDSLKLRTASDTNSECISKTLTRRLNWIVELR